MKDILKITASLTGVCIAAAIILGVVYANTEKLRKEIEKKEKKETVERLLGFGHGKEKPESLEVFPVHRYVVESKEKGTILAYVVPVNEDDVKIIEIDLEGKPLETHSLKGDPGKLSDPANRDKLIQASLPEGQKANYAETFFVADQGDDRLGYVLPGITQGFKTFVKLMVSLDPDFTVTGIAITESEEDPGLGAEIEQEYFRNQFKGKTLDMLKGLEVIKKPLPDEYLNVLEPERAESLGWDEQKMEEIRKKHVKDDIYALTGATISSRAVTKGVKDTVRKFVYRYDILKKAIQEKDVNVAF
jgi:electron transport complex protein RnfG